MEEIWKDIPGYEGVYQVSNMGRIKGLPRRRNGRSNIPINMKGRMLKPKLRNGYELVILHKDNVCETKLIHRLVAQAFIPNPENKPTVNHKKGIKNDNRATELEWMTYSENSTHAYRVLMNPPTRGYTGRFGKLHHSSKPIGRFSLEGELIESYEGLSDASRKTGIFISSIHKAVSGRRKTCHGCLWKYL